MLGGGALALFVGVAVVSSRLVRPIAAVVGWPIGRRGAAGALARENAVRNPSRTAATAAALMIGLALVTFVSVLGAGLIGTARSDVRDQISAAYVVTATDGYGPVTTTAGRHLSAALPGSVVSSVREDRRTRGRRRDPGRRRRPVHHRPHLRLHLERRRRVVAGRPRRRRRRRVPTSSPRTTTCPWGSRVPMVSPSGERSSLTVTGVYDPPSLAPFSPRCSSRSTRSTPRSRGRRTATRSSPTRPARVAAIERTLSAYPDTKVSTTAGYADVATVRPVHDPEHALRAARPVGDRQPVRHGQHAGAGGPRAHPRARACCAPSA